MEHDFKAYPELTNSQMTQFYFESPHKQITENFTATVVKVHDGDTITLSCDFRDFTFPVRFLNTNAPELNETGGHEARDYLKEMIEGNKVDIVIDENNRVGKWGRLLGEVLFRGLNLNDMMMNLGYSKSFDNRNDGKIKTLNEVIGEFKI